MKSGPLAVVALLTVLLSGTIRAAPVPFTNYADFYRSLGGNLFQGPGIALGMPCTDSPRHCLWTTSMMRALQRHQDALWTVPGSLAETPAAGSPDVVFDGKAVSVGARRWPLSGAVDLAPREWRTGTSIRPENLEDVTAWQHGTSVCLDMRYVSSGKGDRYTTVLLLHAERLYILPPLFGTCAAVREAPQHRFSYPSNAYLGPGLEDSPLGLQVDYLLPDGRTRIARYLLRFPDPDNPFAFEVIDE
jgi:hypothetical protein